MKLEPTPPGRFVWKGTQTIQFEGDPRFPFSTDYKVTIPKGTTSKLGGILKEDFKFQFSTNLIRVSFYLLFKKIK